MTFRVKLADIPIEVTALHDSTGKFCQQYFTRKEPLFAVAVQQEEIDYEREKSAAEDIRQGSRLPAVRTQGKKTQGRRC